jgi:hypothetical protein
MSDAPLPEDLRHWPRDPYELLGVPARCDARAARKAYTKLIRHFKPEQFPEHFRLIREAYETVKRQAQYYGQGTAGTPADEGAPDAATPSPTAAADLPQSTVGVDLLQIFWDKACSGQEHSAYAELREMYEINPHGSEVPARLYALLLANPELDALRTPCDWLARGARVEGPWGPCRQLYRREIDDHPDEALSDRFAGFLDAVTPTASVVDILGWRWDALARLGRTELLAEDLRQLAPRLEHADEVTWVRVLLKAADYTAWRPTSLFDTLRKEIDSHVHVHSTMGEELARLDFLRELSASWLRIMKGQSDEAPLLKVVPLSWTSPYENRHRVLLECRPMADSPESALAKLDVIHRQAPLVSAHLGQTLGWLWQTAPDTREESKLSSAVQEYLGGLDRPVNEGDYSLFRRTLLSLCVAEVIAPEVVADVLDPQRTSNAFYLIHDDWPLRVVCLAHRLIWA